MGRFRAKNNIKSTKIHVVLPKWGSRGGSKPQFFEEEDQKETWIGKKMDPIKECHPFLRKMGAPRAPKGLQKSLKINKK